LSCNNLNFRLYDYFSATSLRTWVIAKEKPYYVMNVMNIHEILVMLQKVRYVYTWCLWA